MRTLWMQVARTGTARGYSLAASLTVTFITARYLGPDGRGVVAAAIGWVTLFATFASLSIGPVTFYLSAGRPLSEWVPKTFAGITAILGVGAATGWILAAFCGSSDLSIFGSISRPLLLLAFALLPVMMWNDTANSLLVAMGALERLNLWQVVGSTLTIGAVLTFVVWAGWGVIGALLVTAAYQLTMFVLTLSTVVRRSGGFLFDRVVLRNLLGGGLRLHLSVIATFALMQASVLLLNAFRSAAETGFYHLALQLTLAVQMFSVAVSQVSQSMVAREGADRAWARQKKLLLHSTAATVAIAAVGIVLAPLLVRIAGGAKFLPAVPIFQILLIGLPGMNVSTVMSSQWVARGMFLRLTAISTLLGIGSLVANYLTIPRYGAMAAAWVTTAVYVVSIFINMAMAAWVTARVRATPEAI